MRFPLIFLLVLAAVSERAAEIKGKITNAMGGEALGRVEVMVLETKVSTMTSIDGEFDLPNLIPGSYTLRLNAVGYRMLTIPFTLATASDVKEFSVTMVSDNFRRTDKVEVHGDVFQGADSPATTEINLTSSEIRETSTVLPTILSARCRLCPEFRRKATTNSLPSFRWRARRFRAFRSMSMTCSCPARSMRLKIQRTARRWGF